MKWSKHIPLFSIFLILLAVTFRFFKLVDWVYFGMDQEYQALISETIVHGHHLPLIGVNAADTGIYLGPWFSYLAALIHVLFSGNPVGSAAIASLEGVIVSWLILHLGKQLVGSRAAGIAAILYAGSFLASFYDREFWNPSPVPLVSLLFGYCCYRLEQGQRAMVLWLSVLVGISFSLHLSLLIFFPYVAYVMWKKRALASWHLLSGAVLILGMLLAPLILFDVRHELLNTRAVVRLVQGQTASSSVTTVAQRGGLFVQMLGRLVWIPGTVDLFTVSGQCQELAGDHPFSVFASMLMVGGCLLIFWRRAPSLTIVRYLLVATVVFVLFYQRTLFEYYFLFLFPWLAILIGWEIAELIRYRPLWSVWCAVGIGVSVALNLWTVTDARFSYSYRDKMNTIDQAAPYLTDGDYALEAVGECPRFGGWRYLFAYRSGKTPAHSYMDSYFSWLYVRQPIVQPAKRLVLLSMIDPRLDRQRYRKWQGKERAFLSILTPVMQHTFGRITLFILDERHD